MFERIIRGPRSYAFLIESLKLAIAIGKAARTLEDRRSALDDLSEFKLDLERTIPSPTVPVSDIAAAQDALKEAQFAVELLAGLIINMVEERDYPRKNVADAVPMNGESFVFTLSPASAL